MIKKLYDFRQVDVPAALLQAEVTREELEQELFLAASRFTEIVAPADAIAKGDVVTLEFADEKAEGGLRRVYANVGKDFQDVEALLPGLQLDQPKRAIGRNTVDCMRSGIMMGNAAMLDGMVERMEAELGQKCTVVATGGIAKFIVPMCKTPVVYDKDLLVKGLAALYRENKRK